MSWKLDGACVGKPLSLFYGSGRTRREALSLCASCLVADECLAAKLAEERGAPVAFRFGLVAGTTPLQRLYMYKGRRPAVPNRTKPKTRQAEWNANHRDVARAAEQRYKEALTPEAVEARRRKKRIAERARRERLRQTTAA